MDASGSEVATVTGTRANSFKEKGSDEEPNKSVSVPTEVGGAAVVHITSLIYIQV